MEARAATENEWRWSCMWELIYFISTDLRSGGVSEVDHDGHGKHDDDDSSRKRLPHRELNSQLLRMETRYYYITRGGPAPNPLWRGHRRQEGGGQMGSSRCFAKGTAGRHSSPRRSSSSEQCVCWVLADPEIRIPRLIDAPAMKYTSSSAVTSGAKGPLPPTPYPNITTNFFYVIYNLIIYIWKI